MMVKEQCTVRKPGADNPYINWIISLLKDKFMRCFIFFFMNQNMKLPVKGINFTMLFLCVNFNLM